MKLFTLLLWYGTGPVAGFRGRVGKTPVSAKYKKFLHRPREFESPKKDIFSLFGYGCFAVTSSVKNIHVSLVIGTEYFFLNSNKIYCCSRW
jgi:hypothetical protein